MDTVGFQEGRTSFTARLMVMAVVLKRWFRRFMAASFRRWSTVTGTRSAGVSLALAPAPGAIRRSWPRRVRSGARNQDQPLIGPCLAFGGDGDGDAGVFTSAFTQVLAVGIHQAGTVLGDAEHALGPVGSGVAFDGVQGQLQAAGASEQAHALLEQAMNLMPAFEGGLSAGPVVDRRVQYGGPAGTVCLPLA